jgi:hypothetical protein
MGSNKITGLGTPTATADATTKGYVDGLVAAATLPDADYGDITVSGTGTVWTIDNGVVTSTKIADDTIVNVDINSAAAIAHSKLANITAGSVLLGNASNVPTATALTGDVTVDSSGVTAIGSGVVVDADINASAAIALSKLATGALPTAITVASANLVNGTIVDEDISASAEIAVSKLADGAARQLLQTDSAGTGVEWTDNVDVPGTLDVTSAATFDNNVTIAGNLTVDTNTLYVDSTNNRVGIGTTSPSQTLSVHKSSAGGTTILFTDATNATGRLGTPSSGVVAFGGSTDHNIAFGGWAADSNSFTAERARIDSSGRLLIGTSTSVQSDALIQTYVSSGSNTIISESDSLSNNEVSRFLARGTTGAATRFGQFAVAKHSAITNPVAYLDLNSEDAAQNFIWVDNSGILRISSTFGHTGTTGGTVVGTQTSDERVKNILGPVTYSLATLKQIEPVRYSLKSEPDTEKLGFIAQQVQPLVPQAVFDTGEHIEGEPEDAPTKLGMEYVALIPVLVNAIKELSAEVDALKTQLKAQ